jgi:hypothetical protein
MEIQTLDDVQAWVDRMWGLGRVDGPYEPQELRQVLQVLMQDVMRLKEERAQFTAWHAAQRAQFQAAAAALEAQMAALKVTKLDKAEFEKFVATVMAEYTTLQAA